MAKAKVHALPKGKSKAKAKAKSSWSKGKTILAQQKSLTKGKQNSLTKGKPVKKDLKNKNKLNKAALEKLGNMSLKEIKLPERLRTLKKQQVS